MAKKELRLQYSGFTIFAAKLISVATGFAFQFMLARALLSNINESAQYNIWFNISDVIAYFTLLGAVTPFWVMRYIARGKPGSIKTGIVTNTIISAIFTVTYLAVAPFILSALKISANFLPLYFIAAIQIVELYAINVLESCLQATKPQAIGYGLLFQQVAKLSLGYVLIVQLGLPLLGALISVFFGFAVQVAYYYRLIYEELKQKIQWGYVKEWLKGSSVNIYNVVGTQIAAFVLIMLYNFGSNPDPNQIGARGYFGAAGQIAQIIAFSSFLSFALYPKLLADRKSEDVTTSLKMVLMFAIPMTAGAIALADSYLALLSPEIQNAYMVLVVLAVDALITVFSGFFGAVLFGVETVDQDGMSFRKLVKSRLFLAFSLPYLQAAIALPASYYVLTTYAYHLPREAALYVGIINTAVHLIAFVALYAIVRKMIKVDIPWKSISKYVFASAVMGAFMYLLPHSTRISTTLGMTAVGAGIYLALLLAIDKEARALPVAILREVTGRKKVTAD